MTKDERDAFLVLLADVIVGDSVSEEIRRVALALGLSLIDAGYFEEPKKPIPANAASGPYL